METQQKNNLVKIVVIVGLAVLLLGAGAFLVSRQADKTQDQQANTENQEEIQAPVIEYNEELAKDVETKTYDEIRAKNENVVNPNIPSQEVREKLQEQGLVNTQPENHIIVFDGSTFSPASIQIKQGDAVTFRNNSNEVMIIIGASGWGNRAPVQPSEAFTQGFDYKGDYVYSAGTEQSVTGMVAVE